MVWITSWPLRFPHLFLFMRELSGTVTANQWQRSHLAFQFQGRSSLMPRSYSSTSGTDYRVRGEPRLLWQVVPVLNRTSRAPPLDFLEDLLMLSFGSLFAGVGRMCGSYVSPAIKRRQRGRRPNDPGGNPSTFSSCAPKLVSKGWYDLSLLFSRGHRFTLGHDLLNKT